jgi:hypothetical protein
MPSSDEFPDSSLPVQRHLLSTIPPELEVYVSEWFR